MAEQPLVLLIEPRAARHRHAAALEKAGFRCASVLPDEVDVDRVLDQHPAVIAAELDGSAVALLELVRSLRHDPQTRLIPLVIYGHDLRPQHIEDVARAGALGCNWSQATVQDWWPPCAASRPRLIERTLAVTRQTT